MLRGVLVGVCCAVLRAPRSQTSDPKPHTPWPHSVSEARLVLIRDQERSLVTEQLQRQADLQRLAQRMRDSGQL